MYDNIEKIKDDMTTIVVFGYEPNHDTYTKAMKTRAMMRSLPMGCSIESALSRVPVALDYLNRELSRLSSAALQREIDERVFNILHPPRELSPAEKERVAAIERAIDALNQCDALNVDVGGKIAELQQEKNELLGKYYPGWH